MMRRFAPITTLMLLAACRVTAPPTEPEPTIASVAPEPVEATVPIVIVEQQVLTGVPAGFDPTGRIVLNYECQAWTDDGDFLGTIEEQTCAAWSSLDSHVSPDGARRARLDGRSVIIDGSGPNGTLACDGCAEVLGMAWSPQSDRIAVLREGSQEVEIWSATNFERLAPAPLEWEGAIQHAQLGWSEELILLLATEDPRPLCEDLEDLEDQEGEVDCVDMYEAESSEWGPVEWSVVTYASLDAAPEVDPLEAGSDAGAMAWMGSYDVISNARIDPGGRCLYYEEVDSQPRESIGSRISTIALGGDCLLEYTDESDDWYWSFDSAQWTDGPRPQLVSITTGSYTGPGDDGLEHGQYRVEIVELSETRRRLWSEDVDSVELPEADEGEWVEMTERELLSASADTVVDLAWKHCFSRTVEVEDEDGEMDTEDHEWCEPLAKLPEDCEFVEFDPMHLTALAHCGERDTLTLFDDTPVELGDADDLRLVWGKDWLVTIDDARGVMLRSLASPSAAQRLAPASAWVETTLGPASDRLVLQEPDGLRLVDATSGKDVLRVKTRIAQATGAALAPSGRALAVTDGANIEAIDLSEKRPATMWPALDARVVAWRQDEEAVFSGPDASGPTMAWDARKGELLDAALPDLGEAEVDPSWRWAMSTPHRVIRLLDGLEIWFDESGVLLDDGRFDGEPEALEDIMVRLGDDPLNSPMVAPEDMGSLLHIEGLAEDFFAGRPIGAGPTTVTVRQRDALIGEPDRSARSASSGGPQAAPIAP